MKNRISWNVLVYPGGTENGLEINKSLRYTKEVRLFSASNGVKNHAELVFERHFILPDISDDASLSALNEVIKFNKIDFIFPANSLVIDFLLKNRGDILCRLVLPDDDIVRLTRSKHSTYDFFKHILNVPRTYSRIDDIVRYPVFLKPDSMYGSQGAHKIETEVQLQILKPDFRTNVISDYLAGDEFTIECFSSKKAGLMYSMARTRERVRMGTSMRSERANELIQNDTEDIARKIQSALNIEGLWFFQMKFDERNTLRLLEIETRVAGTMALSRSLGVNLPLASLYLLDGLDFNLRAQKFDVIIDRSLTNRYLTNIEYVAVYIDLDDTIVKDGKLNLEIIKFLYQCIDKKVEINLISKCTRLDKEDYLVELRISQIFNRIIWLRESDSKSDYIIEKRAIFIDDSYSQRKEVEEKLGILTFDPSMIEVLLNDRL